MHEQLLLPWYEPLLFSWASLVTSPVAWLGQALLMRASLWSFIKRGKGHPPSFPPEASISSGADSNSRPSPSLLPLCSLACFPYVGRPRLHVHRYAGLGAKTMLTNAISAPFFSSPNLDNILELSVSRPISGPTLLPPRWPNSV